ncbi:MAG: hypothetical protein JNG88_13340, partial [Phycisphaerales bacterium]|nr:hypothetical protein [Phycisphaerales bacterium]
MMSQYMRRFVEKSRFALLLWTAFCAGCGLDDTTLPDRQTVYAEDVTPIISDSGLSSQAKRDRLGELGLDPITINGLLQADRTGNQFGGTLRTAYDKVKGSRFSALTPDELQIYTDGARSAGASITINLTDEQAQAMRDVLVSENLNSTSDVESYIGDPGNEIPRSLPADAFTQVFISLDPDTVLQQL